MAPPETTRLDAEVERLKQQFGTVSTEKEIEAASHYCSMLRNSKEDELKDKIWRQYLRRHCDTDRVWNEIAIYRLLGRNSRFFVRGQHLDSMALEDLRCALELWVSLAVEGGLTPFLQHEEVKTIYEGDGSAAEVFRAYIDTYKTKAGIHEWKREYMSELRYTIYERVRGIRASKEESSPVPPAKRTYAQIMENEESEIARQLSNKRPKSQNDPVDDNADTHVQKYVPTKRPQPCQTTIPWNSSIQPIEPDVSQNNISPATSELSQTHAILPSSQPTEDELCLRRLRTNILKLKSNYRTAKATCEEKQKTYTEASKAAAAVCGQLSLFYDEARTELGDLLDRGMCCDVDWTSAFIQKLANSLFEFGKSRKSILLSLGDPIEKEEAAFKEYCEASTVVEKHRENLHKLMEVAWALDEN